ncbi:transposable element Tc1 transposase [Trichonephila clavipes]|nr:transposable element Tc1 transposase [Trichonephila clavipes]
MAAVDFLHHENPSTCAGVEPATLGTEGQRQTNHAPADCLRNIQIGNLWKLEEWSGSSSVVIVTLQSPSYTRAFGDGPGNFEPWSSDERMIPELAPPLLNTTPHQVPSVTLGIEHMARRPNCWEQWTRGGTHARKTGSGATRTTTRREDRRIVRQAPVDLTVTRSTIRADVGVAIVPQTISRHVAEAYLKSKHPFRALPLTPEHRQLRLQWCQARSMRNVTDWQKVVFIGESRFVLGTDDNRVRQDNARPHTARVAQDFLRHFQTLPWPARFPYLSPVEHVWDQLKRQMPSCHSVLEFELAVQDLWAHLPQNNIRCLINSMPDRVVACIAAGGGPTHY